MKWTTLFTKQEYLRLLKWNEVSADSSHKTEIPHISLDQPHARRT